MYIALVIKPDGRREVLGFWLFGAEGENAQNWEEVLRDLRRRGVKRVRVFVTNDLPGMEEAVKRIFPEADWQMCVLHAVREALAQSLGAVYRAEDWKEAEEELHKLHERWGKQYPKIVARWEAKADALLAFLKHPREIRPYL